MRLAFIGNSHLDQFNLTKYADIQIIYERGSSIKGLVNPESKLKLKTIINNFIDNSPDYSLVFFLGQVDIEFGYYYKCIIDNIKYDIDAYYDDLIERYKSYLKTLNCNFFILSINPTTITDIAHIFNICFRCNNGNVGYYSEQNTKIILNEHIYSILNDSYDTRLSNHKRFNDKLEDMCLKSNFKYINFWDIIMDNTTNRIKDKYSPFKHSRLPFINRIYIKRDS